MSSQRPPSTVLPEEVELTAIRAQGTGGQNVNKVASAIHLRFDVKASSLPEHIKARLLSLDDRRLTRDGVLVIKAQRFRNQEQNRDDALARLNELVAAASRVTKARVATRPTKGSRQRRLDNKKSRSQTKSLRRPPE
ncbi:MAG: alternative ribosome rescue aminoacyl-tRNA hydrolase ArfB [Gammaproteobacteria bacterium]|nr:alternative ribosome rescue aminoacyl-tRNA hydrolase ArfB [Gammaproteobacteria bacterium]